ncbi:MAG: DUF4358 domain-containing protein [Firmicutes bacterium]|nr:DUF4358 domain-containing protein [Bacillota bacterium]
MRSGKKVVKYICVLFCMAALVCALCGCGGDKTESYAIDEKDFVKQALEQIEFDCQLYQVKEEGIGSFFTFETETDAILYMGAGSFADHLGIFTAQNVKDGEKVLAAVESYKDDLKHSFEDYIPEEAAKIDKAVIVQKGRYVAFCITEDEGAQKFIDEYFENHKGEDDPDQPSDNEGQEGDGDNQDGESQDGDGEEATQDKNVNVESYPVIEKKGKLMDYGNVVAVGDTAYELYSFTEGTGKKYASAVNKTAKALDGVSKVHTLMIPLSSGITLPDKLYGEISSSNQKKALEKLTAMMKDNVTVINPYENLMTHRDEYIYFRTDHHWTADGAYYAYEVLCDAKGLIPISKDEHETKDFAGFLGSFYKDTNESKALKKNPDDVRVYYPVSENTSLAYTATDGKTYNWDVIHDVSDYGASMKYSAFIAGDNPFTEITNEDLTDGSSCIVVKESFGNALVPFLVDHYEKIYVVDYRYWAGNLIKLAKEKKVDDVYFFNNLSMIRSDYLVGKLTQII